MADIVCKTTRPTSVATLADAEARLGVGCFFNPSVLAMPQAKVSRPLLQRHTNDRSGATETATNRTDPDESSLSLGNARLRSTAERRTAIVPPVSIYAKLWKLRFPEDLHEQICAALRGNRAPVVAEIVRPDGTKALIRDRGTDDGAGRS